MGNNQVKIPADILRQLIYHSKKVRDVEMRDCFNAEAAQETHDHDFGFILKAEYYLTTKTKEN